jgi:hypothetical protein
MDRICGFDGRVEGNGCKATIRKNKKSCDKSTINKKCNKSSRFEVYETGTGSNPVACYAFTGAETSGSANRISWVSLPVHSLCDFNSASQIF